MPPAGPPPAGLPPATLTARTARVVVAGLGPGDPSLASAAAVEAMARIPARWLRTTRHPSAALAEPAQSFDSFYETADDIEAVYRSIVETLVAEAEAHGEVLYAVPGSPLVAERTVELLRADPRIATEVIPSVSFLDLAWERLGVDPFAANASIVDAHRFAASAAGRPGPFLVGQCDSQYVLSELKLTLDEGPVVTVLQRLGLPDERVLRVPWADLDREVVADHLTCLWIPALAAPVAAEFVRFEELVRVLRQRCSWDAAQDHHTLTRHLLEETYEVLDSIDRLHEDEDAGYEDLEEELGDLLFQIGFHSILATEAGRFGLGDVARGIHDKLVGRHPHIFGPEGSPAPDWEEQKRREKGRASAMDGVPSNLPSLLFSYKLQSRAASAGFDWDSATGVLEKVHEELDELRRAVGSEQPDSREIELELGDVLFSVVNYARHLSIDPETALRAAAVKFRDRYRAMERLAAETGAPIDDSTWDRVKRSQS